MQTIFSWEANSCYLLTNDIAEDEIACEARRESRTTEAC